MKIIDSIWFNNIGIVMVQTEVGELKAHIGVGKGNNRQKDEEAIAKDGMPFFLTTNFISLFLNK